MTTTDLTETTIALKDLALHELNARAASTETYEADDIAVLAASIGALGLLNPLIVQRTGKTWGVLAGGRRLAALRLLAADKTAKGWTQSMRIACRSIGDDVAAATAITVAENVTQKPMDPLDEFEAFARMMKVGGHTPDSIARTFGAERRRVVDRLRFGHVHPDIRAAARDKAITLDAMKAFAEHPDQSVQLETYEAMKGEYLQAWTIRDRLRKRGMKLGDAIAQAVIEDYRAAGGEIAQDLIEEDSILCDEALVERLLITRLADHAAAEAARLGFAWSDARRECDYKALQEYGRVYPASVDPQGKDAVRCEAIADRLAQIDELRDEGGYESIDVLEEEYEALDREYGALTTGWEADDLARAGVMAFWRDGEIATVIGLIRPEDREDRKLQDAGATGATGATGTTGGASGDGTGSATGAGEESDALVLSESLKEDLKSERAAVIGTALAGDPALAHDLLLFKTVADILGRSGGVAYSLAVTACAHLRPHAKPEGRDPRPAEALAALFAGLDLTWWNDGHAIPERFEGFRALDPVMKSRIVAVALADAVKPAEYGHGEALMAHVARQVVPEMRAHWRPTGEAFFGRLKKSVLLGILARDLGQPEEAARLAFEKKGPIVDFLERLFAAPFATLTPEQREAVESWCPPGMEIEAPATRRHPWSEPLRGSEPRPVEDEDEAASVDERSDDDAAPDNTNDAAQAAAVEVETEDA